MATEPTLEAFSGVVGDAFTVGVPPESSLAMRLVAATALRGSRPAAAHAAEPGFALEFLGPRDPVLPQAIYRFSHASLGAHDIFIVPVGREDDGVRYEAIFN
jgi:hypothetical protein